MRATMCGGIMLVALAGASVASAAQVGSEWVWPEAADAEGVALRVATATAAASSLAKLPAPDAAAIAALKRHNAGADRRALRIGLHRNLQDYGQALDAGRLVWRDLADGGRVAQLSVHAAEAAALRLGLRLSGLPTGAELRFAGTARDEPEAPALDAAAIAALSRTDNLVWTPVTRGDTQTVELYLPAQADARWLRLDVERVSHLLVDPFLPIDRAKINESEQPCMVDVKCISNPSQAFNIARNAVAGMVFEVDGGSSVCSGTLINDSDDTTQVPYFFSAAHCFTTQAVANSLVTLFFYEASGCSSRQEDTTTRQLSGGAQVLYADEPSDVLLLRLNSPAPGGASFVGWDSTPVAVGAPITVIHHPAGDAKKVTQGAVISLAGSTLASGQFIQTAYSVGATEGGSSGSALLTLGANGYALRGGLLGGSSTCELTGTDDEGNSDDYSRFDLAFPALRQFLQGGGGGNPPQDGTDYSGAWSNPAEDGWGLVIVRGGSGAYGMYIYHYDNDSSPAWYLSFGGLQGSSFDNALLGFRGPWFGTSPFNPGNVQPREAGTLRVTFDSPTSASISFTIDGRSVSTRISKLAF